MKVSRPSISATFGLPFSQSISSPSAPSASTTGTAFSARPIGLVTRAWFQAPV